MRPIVVLSFLLFLHCAVAAWVNPDLNRLGLDITRSHTSKMKISEAVATKVTEWTNVLDSSSASRLWTKWNKSTSDILANIVKVINLLPSLEHAEYPASFLRRVQGIIDKQKSTVELDDLNWGSNSRISLEAHQLFRSLESKLDFGALSCDVCQAVVSVVQILIARNSSSEDIKVAAYAICTRLKIEEPHVCKGLIDEFAPEILTVLENLVLSPSEVCGLVIGPSCGDPYFPWDNWNVTFPSTPQPPPVYPSLPKEGSPTLRFLHLTDIHYDALYKVGANAQCGEPLCCRVGSGDPPAGSDGAWKFGDYRNCDTPLGTLENMFTTLAAQNDTFDYIIWTGDLPAHNVWDQSRSAQIATLRHVVALILKYFPNKPVYPSLGNHESSPVNSFPPPYIKGNNSITWLYEVLADGWKHWLPKDALDSVRRGAYYTVTPYAGFRIISLNMNYCNNENWWMLLNTTDPTGELQWLIATLQQAEDTGEKVHILGHIPPGVDDCLKTWSWNYYKIVSRYQNTIAGQFFGHTHNDAFEVFYDVETLKIPVGVAYIAPSVTPFTDLNMAYRFYIIDGNYKNSSFQVLDHETFYLDLAKANEEGYITWEFEYSAKAAFNMSSTFPKDWDNLINVMKNNKTVLETYNKFYTKSRYSGACDDTCRALRLCECHSGRSHDHSLCDDLGVSEDEFKALKKRQTKNC